MKYILPTAIILFTFLDSAHAGPGADLLSTCPALKKIKLSSQKTSFVQKKYIPGISKPILSKGEISENQSRQIEIETLEPEEFKATFDTEKMYITKKNSDGEVETSEIENDEAVALSRFIVTLLRDKNDEEISYLGNNYTIECASGNVIEISGMKKADKEGVFIESFRIEGKNEPSLIEIVDSDQNKLVIEISHG